jgi:alpha-tubulin suppressor-like RCC1 family protein
LYCWGDASSGKIGTAASSGTRTTPLRIGSSSTWTAVSSGFSFGCGIDAGTPHCWGSTTFGALGVGSTQSTLKTPTAVAAPGTFVAIDSGTFFSCALRNDGALHCWGDNQYGQAGTSDVSTQLLAPGAAHTSMSFDSISANYNHACGLSNGAAYCWGSNLRDLTNTGDGFNLTPVANGL